MKFDHSSRRTVAFALYVAFTFGAVAPAFAQSSDTRPTRPQRGAVGRAPTSLQGGQPRGLVPTKRASLVGEGGKFIPADVTQRSTVGVTGFPQKAGATRVQIGGPSGANVVEKVVDITQTQDLEERTPFWANDEQALYFSSNRDGRYNLYRVSPNPAPNAQTALPTVPLTANSTFDYLFPSVDAGNTRMAFLRSSDTLPIDDPNKRFDLYVSNLPLTSGQLLDENVGGPLNLTPISRLLNGNERDFPTGSGNRIVNVRRASWIGSTQLAFVAKLQNKDNYDLFIADVVSQRLLQITDSPADEQNPAVSPDGRTIAFDSDAVFVNDTTSETYSAGVPRTDINPTAVPANAARNGNGQRQVYTMSVSGTDQPRQFTGRFTAAGVSGAITNVEPAWSSTLQNDITNPNTLRLSLAWSSNRQVVYDPADATKTLITGYNVGTTYDVYYAIQTTDYRNPAASVFENDLTDAKRLDTDDDQFRFNDRYPTWAPFITAFRISFQSNRIGTYGKDGFGSGFTGPIPANDLLIASVIDIAAPTLIRFDTGSATGEVVHINPGTSYNADVSVRTREDGVLPNSDLFFTVRVEDREAGMRQPTAPGQTPKAVFLQFKNPNSKYQSIAQGGNGVEHKEFEFFANAQQQAGLGGFTFSETSNAGPVNVQMRSLTNGVVHGAEYEYEAISALDRVTYFRHRQSVGAGPLYLPGVDDRLAYTGVSAGGPFDGSGANRPGVWLELLPLVDGNGNAIRPKDGRGGILYGANWKIPAESSDWVIDVICYDNAVNPFAPAQRSNWIIYDNVWGFSSALPISGQSQDVLVISDYSLGQKFFAARFDTNSDPVQSGNLPAIAYGAESYFTDIDITRFPTGQAPFAPGSTTARFWDPVGPFGVTSPGGGSMAGHRSGQVPTTGAFVNTLGVNSYVDEALRSGMTVVDGRPLAPTTRYNIWRVISRGPVPDNLLQAYLPQKTITPPDLVADPAEQNPRNVDVYNRCVVWLSPLSGNVFVGPGTITDQTTQAKLTAFVNQGGRIFVSGQDIGFALAGAGQANGFLADILGAQYGGDGLNANAANDLTAAPVGTPYDGFIRRDGLVNRNSAYGQTGNGVTWSYNPPSDGLQLVYRFTPTAGDRRGDGGFTAAVDSENNDFVLPVNGAVAEFTYGGGPAGSAAMISKSFPTGGRTTFAAFGFESLSTDWYSYTDPGGTTFLASLGRRAEMMHNIVGSFRTGRLLGRVIDDNGSPVSDALVRALGGAQTGNVAAGTGLTDQDGNFVILGLIPGFYQVEAVRTGFYTQKSTGNTVHGGWQASTNIAVKRASPGALGGIPQSATNQGGIFRADGVTPIENVEVRAELIEPTQTGSRIIATRAISSDGDDSNNDAQAADPRFAGAIIGKGPKGAYQFPSLAVAAPQFGYHLIANPSDSPAVRTEFAQDIRLTSAPDPTKFRLGPGTTVVDGDPNPAVDRGHVVIEESKTAQVDFLLSSGPQQVVGGVFEQTTDASGNVGQGAPIAGATVQAVAVVNGTPGTTIVASATTAQDGTYRLVITGGDPNNPNDILIPEGIYDITASAPGYASTKPPSERPVVRVTVGGVSTVPVAAPSHLLFKLPPGSASGNVTRQPGNQPVAGATIRLYPVIGGVRQPNPIATVATSVAPQQNNGGYLFNWKIDTVPAGDYQATASLAGFVSDPVFSGVFTVTSGQETRNINFTLRSPKDYGAGLQLISVPFDYSNVPSRSVFGLETNDGFNLATWLAQQGTYQTGPDLPLQLGKGYFARFPSQVSIALVGAPNQADTADIPLFPGWNLIGNPFSDKIDPSVPGPNLDLGVDARIVLGDGSVLTLDQAVAQNLVRGVAFGYTGSNQNSQYFQSTVIQTWLGYWFRNTDPQQRTLTLRFVRPTNRAVKLTSTRAITRAETEAVRFRSITTTAPNNWRLQIAAKQGDLLDTDNSIGVAPGAKDGFDNKFDTEKPAMMTEAPQVYVALDAKNEAGRAAPFSDDIRAADSEGFKTWEFTVQATGQGEVTVFWPNINRLPRNVEPVLVDLASNRRVAMRGTSTYRFAPEGTGATTRRFRVEVAKPLSLPLTLTNVKQTRVLGRGPGGGGFRFSFTVSRSADVVAEIQTLTGRTVQRMSSRAAASTESSILWNGRNQEGAVLPAGPYVLALTARDTNGNTAQVRLPIMQLR
ncbi:MAG TPA: carboxypeptidase regulatory-like domain-containing protein [Armatimonadaceae bacterium]|nr:carboxypeptidase regulatory-like domain-containing protein [Armatimonadaceae bacterium]